MCAILWHSRDTANVTAANALERMNTRNQNSHNRIERYTHMHTSYPPSLSELLPKLHTINNKLLKCVCVSFYGQRFMVCMIIFNVTFDLAFLRRIARQTTNQITSNQISRICALLIRAGAGALQHDIGTEQIKNTSADFNRKGPSMWAQYKCLVQGFFLTFLQLENSYFMLKFEIFNFCEFTILQQSFNPV